MKGNAHTLLQDPTSAAISESMAAQYFGDEDPLGKVLTTHHRYYSGSFIIRGVLKDLPPTTTIQFDMLAATNSPGMSQDHWDVWRPTGIWGPVFNYILLEEDADVTEFEDKLQVVIQKSR